MSSDPNPIGAMAPAQTAGSILRRLDERLVADPTRVVIRPFQLSWHANGIEPGRAVQLVRDVQSMTAAAVTRQLNDVMADFEGRHWHIHRMFDRRFNDVAEAIGLDRSRFDAERRYLIGAYLSHEYSYAAAALMNPTVTPHPDQSGISRGSLRVVMAMRAVGEGHISSIVFRDGIIDADESLYLSPQPAVATTAIVTGGDPTGGGVVTVTRDPDSRLSGTVIFPVTPAQANGLEDLRLTRLVNDRGDVEWIGTYTAYSGRDIRSELLRTRDFQSFDLQPMRGGAAVNKGMALFPAMVDGAYLMIGRQDGKNLYLLRSRDVGAWDEAKRLMQPLFPWEFIQIGNCGPPIEIDEGWLLLTHGVGPMRKYAIGAALLDKRDPSRVLGRTPQPLLAPVDHDREGYVPNVVYSCGGARVGDKLFLPYGISDSAIGFAFADLSDIVAQLV